MRSELNNSYPLDDLVNAARYLSVFVPTCLSICICFYLSIYLYVFLPVYLSVFISTCLSICICFYLSIYLYLFLHAYISVFVSTCLSICICFYLSIYMYRIICLFFLPFSFNIYSFHLYSLYICTGDTSLYNIQSVINDLPKYNLLVQVRN